jgi:opacity protein-like surface antigen
MKKQFLIFAIASAMLMSIGLNSQAQMRPATAPPAQNMITGGLKGGLNMSNMYIDVNDIDASNARWGFHVGLFSQIMFAETIGFQPEILFTTKGTSAEYTGIFNQTVDFNLNYIDLPLFLVFRPFEVVEFHAGPYVGFLLNSNVGFTGTIDGQTELNRDNFNAFDWGLGAGLQFNFRSVILGLRYNMGMQNVGTTTTANLLLGDVRHSYGQVYVAFGLPRIF